METCFAGKLKHAVQACDAVSANVDVIHVPERCCSGCAYVRVLVWPSAWLAGVRGRLLVPSARGSGRGRSFQPRIRAQNCNTAWRHLIVRGVCARPVDVARE